MFADRLHGEMLKVKRCTCSLPAQVISDLYGA